MFRDTILKVINKYPAENAEEHARILGISDRTLYRYKRRFRIVKLRTVEIVSA